MRVRVRFLAAPVAPGALRLRGRRVLLQPVPRWCREAPQQPKTGRGRPALQRVRAAVGKKGLPDLLPGLLRPIGLHLPAARGALRAETRLDPPAPGSIDEEQPPCGGPVE